MEVAVTVIEAEFLLPLTDSTRAAIVCTWALARLLGGEAEDRLERVRDSADPRIRLYISKCILEDPVGPLFQECRFAPNVDNEEYCSSMRTNLADPEEECRSEFLELALRRPAAEIFADVAGRLTDSSHRVRMRAAQYLKIGATRDPAQLQALLPALVQHPESPSLPGRYFEAPGQPYSDGLFPSTGRPGNPANGQGPSTIAASSALP